MDEYNNIWSPYKIKLVLHAHAVRSQWAAKDAPIYRETIDELSRLGLLQELPDGTLITTDKGDVLVSMWCSTPMPEQVWIDPRSGKPA